MSKTLPFIILFYTLFLPVQECQYEAYFQITDLAKKQTASERFTEARANFQEAFSQIEFPLGHDLSVALYVADQTKDFEWASLLAKKLAMGGAPLRYFSKFKNRKWYNEFELKFEEYAKFYKTNFNHELRNRFMVLSRRDIEFTERYHSWREGKIEMTLEELIDGATEIVTEFIRLNEEYGFPDEQKMGYNYVRRKNDIEPYDILAVVVHIYQRGVLILQDDIPNIVCSGGLHPGYEKTLKQVRGFGNSTGVEQEMQARYSKYRGDY
ncbi:hypothetical protein [Robiginitalea sp.]|uniref:hypothetical protein n=1 Tax=Robiginitalea sp. TaxID=1902411 RepID=UPI003C58F8A1